MKYMRSNKGITLLALVITIIVLTILASAVIYSMNSSPNTGKFNKMKADIELLHDKVLVYYQRYEELPRAGQLELVPLLAVLGDQRAPNDSDIYYIIDLSKLEGLTLNYGNKKYGTDDIYIINSTTFNIYYLKGIELEGTVYHVAIKYTGSIFPAKIIWDEEKGVNTPQSINGMKAVYWGAGLNEIIQGEPNFEWEEWYEYIEQSGSTDGKTSRWANVITEDGNYWVWIPRFEYKIDYTGVEQGVATDTTKAGKIHVRFIPTTTKSGSPGYTTDSNGIVRSSDGYIIHPAFTNNINQGGWDRELDGFWIAKYQISMVNDAGTNINTSNDTIGNVALSGNVKVASKPGLSSWRNINIANCYENSYNYDRKRESHLIKNSEWGAVVYLTHSQYGRNGTGVTKNSSYITGGGAGTAFKTNQTQSSTGNVYGVYDLCGNGNEYVGAFNKEYTLGYYYADSLYVCARGTHFASVGGESTRYATTYGNATTMDTPNSLADFTSSGKKVSYVGDAFHEVWIRGGYLWFSGICRFIALDPGLPTYKRGVSARVIDEGNVFYNGSTHGYPAEYNGFRIALCPQDGISGFRYYINITDMKTTQVNTTTINISFTVKNHDDINYMAETLKYNIYIEEDEKWEIIGGKIEREIIGGAKRNDAVNFTITLKNGESISSGEKIRLIITTTYPRNDVKMMTLTYI